MKIVLKFNGVLLSCSGVLLSDTGVLLSGILNNILKKEFYVFLWSSTVAYKEIFKNYLKYGDSIVVLSVGFYCRWSS